MLDDHIEGKTPSPETTWKCDWLIWLLSNVVLAFNGLLWLYDEDRTMQVIGGLIMLFTTMTIGRLLVMRKTSKPPHPSLRAAMLGLLLALIVMLCYQLLLTLGSLTEVKGRLPD